MSEGAARHAESVDSSRCMQDKDATLALQLRLMLMLTMVSDIDPSIVMYFCCSVVIDVILCRRV